MGNKAIRIPDREIDWDIRLLRHYKNTKKKLANMSTADYINNTAAKQICVDIIGILADFMTYIKYKEGINRDDDT